MSKLMSPVRMSELANVAELPSLPPEKPIAILQWTIDAETGRPISRWVLGKRALSRTSSQHTS